MTQPTTSEARAALLEYADRYGYTDHVNTLLNAYRAAVLHEAADSIDGIPTGDCSDADSHDEAWDWGAQAAATELRRMAEEARS
ncbi:hypothetical protein ACWFR1_34180 [Streptomyces sp. NPDC055103]